MASHSSYSVFEVLYKKGKETPDPRLTARESLRRQRNDRREKLISNKRLRVDNLEEAEILLSAEDESEKVKNATKLLKQGKRVEALTILHRCFARNPDNADTFIRCEGLQLLQSCFMSSDSEILHVSAWCAVNLCAGDHSTVQKLMRFSPLLIQFLQGSDVVMQELCAWAIGNLAGDCQGNRDTLLQQGCIPHLINLISSKHHLTLEARSQNVLFALINLARDESCACIRCMQENSVFQHIITMLTETSVTCDLCFEIGWFINSICVRPESFTEYSTQSCVILSHIIDKLSQIVSLEDTSQRDKMILPYLISAANIVGQSPNMATPACEHPSFLSTVVSCLTCEENLIKREALRILANTMVVPSCRVLIMCQPKILNLMLDLCQGNNVHIAQDALYLVEATSRVSSHINTYLVQQGVVHVMVKLLTSFETKIKATALSVLVELLYGSEQGKIAFQEAGGSALIPSLFRDSTPEHREALESLNDLLSNSR